MLFTNTSTAEKYVTFNQSEIMGSDFVVDDRIVEEKGVPYFATTFVTYILSTNLAIVSDSFCKSVS